MKAWRRNAAQINAIRRMELATTGYITTPTARAQKEQSEVLRRMARSWVRTNWLLSGLMERAGIVAEYNLAGTSTRVAEPIDQTAGIVGKVKAAFKTMKNWFAR